MTLEVYSCKTFDRICRCPDVDEFNIYKVDNKWILGIEYFDESIEMDQTDTMTLCEAPTEEAFDEIFILKTSGDNTELFSSERTRERLKLICENDALLKALCRPNLTESEKQYVENDVLSDYYGR